jgi:hypothetical protein
MSDLQTSKDAHSAMCLFLLFHNKDNRLPSQESEEKQILCIAYENKTKAS